MDELKELISMMAGLPTVVVWVLVGYLVYKLAVLGSIYGVLRLLIERAHDWVTRPERTEWELDGIVLTPTTKVALAQQLVRLCEVKLHYSYFTDVDRLRKAIDLLLAQEAQERAEKKAAASGPLSSGQ